MSTGKIRTRTRDTILDDELRTTPVDRALARRGRLWFWSLLLIIAAITLSCLLPIGGAA
jgi:hypothetical protein